MTVTPEVTTSSDPLRCEWLNKEWKWERVDLDQSCMGPVDLPAPSIIIIIIAIIITPSPWGVDVVF